MNIKSLISTSFVTNFTFKEMKMSLNQNLSKPAICRRPCIGFELKILTWACFAHLVIHTDYGLYFVVTDFDDGRQMMAIPSWPKRSSELPRISMDNIDVFNVSIKWHRWFGGLWYLTPLLTIFQLYHGGQFYWNQSTRRKPLTCRKSLTNFIK